MVGFVLYMVGGGWGEGGSLGSRSHCKTEWKVLRTRGIV